MKQPCRAANQYFQNKDNKYLALSQANNLEFLPIIFENTGRMHPKTDTFLCLKTSMQDAAHLYSFIGMRNYPAPYKNALPPRSYRNQG